MPKCSSCKTDKPSSDFNRKTGQRLNSKCRDCQQAYHKRWYQGVKEKVQQRVYAGKSSRRRLAQAFIAAAKARPCVDCGGRFPSHVMDLDHLDRSIKKMNISMMVSHGFAVEAIAAELAKCEVVCANCHRDRTYRRGLENGFSNRPAGERLRPAQLRGQR